MFNTVPVNGWPQIKALEGTDSLPETIDTRITSIEEWIEEVAPTDQAANIAAIEGPEEPVKKTTRKKVVKDGK